MHCSFASSWVWSRVHYVYRLHNYTSRFTQWSVAYTCCVWECNSYFTCTVHMSTCRLPFDDYWVYVIIGGGAALILLVTIVCLTCVLCCCCCQRRKRKKHRLVNSDSMYVTILINGQWDNECLVQSLLVSVVMELNLGGWPWCKVPLWVLESEVQCIMCTDCMDQIVHKVYTMTVAYSCCVLSVKLFYMY